jgi:hypothetical protein
VLSRRCARTQDQQPSGRSIQRKYGISQYQFQEAKDVMGRGTISGKTHHIGVFAEMADAEQAVVSFRAKHGFDPGHGAELAHYVHGQAG